MMVKPMLRTLALLALAGMPMVAHAQADAADAVDSGDTAFVLGAGLLGFGMILPGAVLHHGGALRARAFAALAVQTGAIAAVVSLLWIMVGYTLAFGTVTTGWLGSGNAWMLIDLANVRGASAVPEVVFVWLQLGFAVLAASALTGAWAERGNIAWIVPFAGLWSILVYAPIAHWLAGGGWLAARLGTVDTGGALHVHACIGISALVITLLMGRRTGFAPGDRPPGHAPAVALAGCGMVWVALLALTAGSTLAASDDAGTTLINLQVAAATGALVWLLIDAMTLGKVQPLSLARGALAGLIAASAAAEAYAPGAAMVAGLIGAVMAWIGARLIRAGAIDDAVDLVSVHGIAGLAGAMLAAPLIAGTLGGTGYAVAMGPARQVVAQAVAAGAVVAWSAIGTAIAALMVAMVVPMRVSEADEARGLDEASHGIKAKDD
jgi:Amt family ammonium transporter